MQSVLDEAGQVRKFDRAFRLRGLLWCTSTNEAMNDHLAQFVKGAHLLTAGAVILVTIAAVPAAIMLNKLPVGPTAISIVGAVDVSSGGLKGLQAELTSIQSDLESLKKGKGSQDEVLALKNRVAAIELRLKKSQKPSPRKQ